jgi:hypothetical protein
MAISDDPYFAGRILDNSGKGLGSGGPPPVLAWIWVYTVNLGIPVMLGSMFTCEGGRVGMVIGIIVVFAIGCRVCFVSRRTVLMVVYGGWIVALSQAVPALHIIAGTIGLSAVRVTTGEERDLSTILGGFIATLITGCVLISVATALGAVVQGIISWSRRRTNFGAKAYGGEG